MTFPVVDTTYYITRLRGGGGGVVVLFINQEESSTVIRMHLGPGEHRRLKVGIVPQSTGAEKSKVLSLFGDRDADVHKRITEKQMKKLAFPLLQPCARVCARAQIKYKTPKDAGARTVMICYISCFCLFFLQGPHPPGEYTHMCTSFFFLRKTDRSQTRAKSSV